MRRFALCGTMSLVMLAACSTSALPPREVMQRAMAASKELESARFTASGFIRMTGDERWDFNLDNGILKDAGKQVQFTLKLKRGLQGGELTVLDIALLFPCDLFLKPVSVASGTTLLGLPYEKLRGLEEEWWRVSCKGMDTARIAMQPDIFTVAEEKEREKLNGRETYHYAISIHKDKLQSLPQQTLRGELWIDTRTFYIHRLVWTLNDGSSNDKGSFDLQLRDHDGVPSSPLPPRARLLTGVTLTDGDLPSLIPGFPILR